MVSDDPVDLLPPTRRERMAARRRVRQRRRLLALGGLGVVAAIVVGVVQILGDSPAARTAEGSTTTSSRAVPPASNPPATVPAVFNQPPFAEWVRTENAKPGTASWRLTEDGSARDMEGYFDVTSAQRGQTVTLYATTVAPTFTIEAYRMGWYQGLGARLVWTSEPIPGRVQAPPTRIDATNSYEARWDPSTKITIGADWPEGSYLFKMTAATGQQRWVPLTVRNDASTATFAIVNAVTTWQAYNRWGGCSLYSCPGAPGDRSKMVSFDRPYDIVTDGSGDFVGNELALIMRAEQSSFDVTYITDVDIHQRPDLLKNHRAVMTLGHDEYWTQTMFDAAEQARDSGVNLAFFGANAVFRVIRFEPSALGVDRHMVNYRSTTDPIRSSDPRQTTVNFRESPVNRPEARLIGQQYQCNPVRADMVVVNADSWFWAGTDLRDGDRLEIGVGSEYDQYIRGQGGPDNVELFAHSPVVCRGNAAFADVTYYTAPSGAGVIAVGTNYWVSKLTPPEFPESPFNAAFVTATNNVFYAFANGPAGQERPSQPNWRDLPGTSNP